VTTSRYQYQLEMLRDDYTVIAQMPIAVDWQPAVEWTRLSAVRSGLPVEAMAAPCAVDPIWHADAGEPYISGFKVAVDGGSRHECDFRFTYWRALAKMAATALIDKGLLNDGERFRYRVTAFACEAAAPSDGGVGLDMEEVAPDLHITEGVLADLVGRSTPVGTVQSGDFPVFIPKDVMEEAARLKDEAEALETGSILIGRLHIDRTLPKPEVFAVVSAQVPARYTRSELTSINFTADTWADVHNAIALRGADELMLAWFHTHPTRHFCKCETCDRSRCSFNKDFFSIDDRLLHRSVFPRAWTSALVMSDVLVGRDVWTTSSAFYGWREGVIVERGFYELDYGHPAQTRPVAIERGANVVKRNDPVHRSTSGGGRGRAGH
jgi:hypothetical protein